MTIEEVYDALLTTIGETIVTRPTYFYQVKDKALLIPFSSLKGAEESWGAQFRSQSDSNRIRAWFWTQIDSNVSDENDRRRQIHAEWVIQVRCYMLKRQGHMNDNSDRDFNMEVNAVEKALNGDAGTLPLVLRRSRPFKMARNARDLGAEPTHFAVGNLYVQSC